MAAHRKMHSLLRVPKSRKLIEVAAAAIEHVSNEQQQLLSVRPTAVAGFQKIIDDDRITLVILQKIHDKIDFSGEGYLHIAFSADDMRLLREARAALQTLSLEKIDNAKTIRMALLRHARPEFATQR